MVPKNLDDRNDKLFKKLVPFMGKAATIEGETLRALNKIIYRYYNDGDYWYDGYGIETAGPAEAFLREFAPIDLRKELMLSDGAENEDYETALNVILERVLTYIESRTEYTPNHWDMQETLPKYDQESQWQN